MIFVRENFPKNVFLQCVERVFLSLLSLSRVLMTVHMFHLHSNWKDVEKISVSGSGEDEKRSPMHDENELATIFAVEEAKSSRES